MAGRGVVRPETALYELGTHVQTRPAEDGGRDRELDVIAGIVIGVADRADDETGELVRTFEILVTSSTRDLLVRWVPESALELGAAYPAQTSQLRNVWRNVAKWIGGRKGPTDSDELAAWRIVATLLEAAQ